MTAVVVTTATATSLAKARSALASLGGPGGFSDEPRIFVCNAMVAGFDDAEGQEWNWLLGESSERRQARAERFAAISRQHADGARTAAPETVRVSRAFG